MKSLVTYILENANLKNPKANYRVLKPFTLPNQNISLNGSSPTTGYIDFKKDDEIATSAQSGSLGDIWEVTNLRTNQTAKFWSMEYGLPKEMKGNVISREDISRSSRTIKFDRSEWYLRLLTYTKSSDYGKNGFTMQIYSGTANTRFGYGFPTTAMLAEKNISNHVDNICLVGVEKAFANSTEAERFRNSVLIPAKTRLGINDTEMKIRLFGSNIGLEFDYKLNDISCFPPNWKGKDFKKKITKLIAEVFYFDIDKVKQLKEPIQKKLPVLKDVPYREMNDKIKAFAKKIDKGNGVRPAFGEIARTAFLKAVSELPYDYLVTRCSSVDSSSNRNVMETKQWFMINSEEGERFSYIEGTLHMYGLGKNLEILQDEFDLSFFFKTGRSGAEGFIPESDYRYVEYSIKHAIMDNLQKGLIAL